MMLVSDIYKVIDDDIKFEITYNNGVLSERVKGDNWYVVPEHVLDWTVRRMFIGNRGTLFIDCR